MPALNTPITTDDRGLKKVLGQKQPALLVLFDGTQTNKPLDDALKREAKKRDGDLLVVRVDTSDNPGTLAKYDHPDLPALFALTPAFFGRNIKSSAEDIRPADVRHHVAHLLDDKPLPQRKEKSSNGAAKGKKPVTLTNKNFKKEVLKSKQPVLVDFWAPWCGPCLNIAPFIEEMADTYKGKVKVGKLNTETNRRVASEFGIQSIPTFILFQDGEAMARFSGANPGAIQRMLEDATQ